MVPKTEWSNVAKTKSVLRDAKPKEESYFDMKRIVPKEGSKVSLDGV